MELWPGGKEFYEEESRAIALRRVEEKAEAEAEKAKQQAAEAETGDATCNRVKRERAVPKPVPSFSAIMEVVNAKAQRGGQ